MTITRQQLEQKKKARKACTMMKKLAICFGVCSVILLFIAFFTPPPYMIDNSVIIAVGEIFAFATLFFAWESVDRGLDAKIKHGGTSVELNNHEEDK